MVADNEQVCPGRRGRPSGGSCCKWEEQHVMELSTLLLRYKSRCGKLPTTRDHIFWEFCCDRFHARFTTHQILSKMRCLKRRFLHLSSGRAKSVIKPAERQTYHIWTKIMQQAQPAAPAHQTTSSADTPRPPSGVFQKQQATAKKSTISPAARFGRSNNSTLPRQASAHYTTAGNYTGKHGMNTDQPSKRSFSVDAADNVGKGGDIPPPVARSAGEFEEEQDTSTCTSQGNELPNQHQEHETAQEDAQDANGQESSVHNMALLHHTTVADLAAAIKLLAEILHSPGPDLSMA